MTNILTGNLILTAKQDIARDTLKLQFLFQDLQTLTGDKAGLKVNYTPGQFLSVGFSQTAWRAYSIASIPSEKTLELLVRIVPDGVGSMTFAAANIGDSFPFKGPFGHFQLSENVEAELVFCATGTGIAPFRSMIKTEALQASPRPMTLLYGGKDADDIAYLEEINQWSRELKVKLGLSRDPSLNIPKGVKCEAQNDRITALLEAMDIQTNHEFYLCGNGAMVQSVQSILQHKAVAKERIFMERFN